MTDLVLPPAVIADRTRKQLEQGIREGRAHLVALDKALKDLDPYLELVLASPRAQDPTLIPGAWHVVRHNPIGVPSYLPITDDDGYPVEPHFGVLDWLRARDLQDRRVLDDIAEERGRAAHDREMERLAKRSERREEIAGRMKALESPGVSMVPGWTNKSVGRKARREQA